VALKHGGKFRSPARVPRGPVRRGQHRPADRHKTEVATRAPGSGRACCCRWHAIPRNDSTSPRLARSTRVGDGVSRPTSPTSPAWLARRPTIRRSRGQPTCGSTTNTRPARLRRGGRPAVTPAAHQKAIDRAVFPGRRGETHNHTTAGTPSPARGGERRVYTAHTPTQLSQNAARAGGPAWFERWSLVREHRTTTAPTPHSHQAGSPAKRSRGARASTAGLELQIKHRAVRRGNPPPPGGPGKRSTRRGSGRGTQRSPAANGRVEMSAVSRRDDAVVGAHDDAALHARIAGRDPRAVRDGSRRRASWCRANSARPLIGPIVRAMGRDSAAKRLTADAPMRAVVRGRLQIDESEQRPLGSGTSWR